MVELSKISGNQPHVSGSLPATPTPSLPFFESLPSITSARCAIRGPDLDRTFFREFLHLEGYNVAYGTPCPDDMTRELRLAVRGCGAGFYDIFHLNAASLDVTLREWFQKKKLGDLNGELAHALYNDIRGDALQFMKTIASSDVTLRLILDTSSGFGELLTIPLLTKAPFEQTSLTAHELRTAIDRVAKVLEYERAYLYHIDEYAVNQIKSYCGATTLVINASDMEREPHYDHWFEIFQGEESLRTRAFEALQTGDIERLYAVIQDCMNKVWDFQTRLPGVLTPGVLPYTFQVGAPHLYLGTPEKLDFLGHTTPKTALHAKPLIWAQEPNARRFLTILDSPKDYSFS